MTQYYFTNDHEYIRKQDDIYYMGISHFAQKELGDIVFVELPEKGTTFKQGDIIATVESVKAASDVYAPCDCQISAVNKALEDKPEIVNENAQTDGWLITFIPFDKTQLDALISKDDYTQYVK